MNPWKPNAELNKYLFFLFFLYCDQKGVCTDGCAFVSALPIEICMQKYK